MTSIVTIRCEKVPQNCVTYISYWRICINRFHNSSEFQPLLHKPYDLHLNVYMYCWGVNFNFERTSYFYTESQIYI